MGGALRNREMGQGGEVRGHSAVPIQIFRNARSANASRRARDRAGGAPLSTLGNEIDKLAGNIALGHYRSDSVRGLCRQSNPGS